MSMACQLQKDPLHDMYSVLLRCRSFQNESGMCAKSIEVVRAMVCSMDAKTILQLHGNWDGVSPSIFQFGPPAGVQNYMFFQKLRVTYLH